MLYAKFKSIKYSIRVNEYQIGAKSLTPSVPNLYASMYIINVLIFNIKYIGYKYGVSNDFFFLFPFSFPLGRNCLLSRKLLGTKQFDHLQNFYELQARLAPAKSFPFNNVEQCVVAQLTLRNCVNAFKAERRGGEGERSDVPTRHARHR